jgi:hypothetical protein
MMSTDRYTAITYWRPGRPTRSGPSFTRIWAVADSHDDHVVSTHETLKGARAAAAAKNLE